MKQVTPRFVRTGVFCCALGRKSDLLDALAVFQGRRGLGFAENLGEVAERREAQKLRNLGQGKIRFCQEILALFDAPIIHVVDRGDAVLLFEGVG